MARLLLIDKTACATRWCPACPPISAAHAMAGEWRLQRLTAMALIPLSLYFAASILSLAPQTENGADWLSSLYGLDS